MNCLECKELLVEYIEELLDESRKQDVSQHLSNCQTCRDELQSLKDLNERLVQNGKAVAQSNLEEKVLDKILREQRDQLRAANEAGLGLKTWRKIMKNHITKFAAAALIIIAVFVAIPQFGVSSVAWSQVVEQMNKYTKYKCRQRVVQEQGPEYPTMLIYHLNLQQRRQEVEDGTIHIIDMRGDDAVIVELHPDEKKATVTRLIGFGPRQDPAIIDMVKRFDEKSTERLGTKQVDSKTLYGFRHQPNEYNDFTVWIDPDTKLPVEIELKHPTVGQTIFLDGFEFDFNLDESAFSTDVPAGYEVETIIQDDTPVEPKQITAEDIRTGLTHTAYTIKKLPWMQKLIIMQLNSPLVGVGKVYMIGVLTDDDNNIIIDQSNIHSAYKEMIMEWILSEELVMETPSGAKLYADPDGSEYARLNLESFAKASPEFFDIKNLSEERFTRVIIMPDETIIGLSVNKQISEDRLQELVESLVEINAD